MIGNYAVTQTTYAEFCDTLRRLASGVTDERLYHEWCRAGEREGPIDYDRIAMRIATTHPKRLLRDAVMTTDQLRADAENVELGIRRRGASNFTDCAYRLARFAALMTDETPVDEAWLRKVGTVADGAGGPSLVARISTKSDVPVVLEKWGDVWRVWYRTTFLGDNPARGQLRALLFALTREVKP